MIAQDRHLVILQILEKRERMAFSELLSILPASPATLRRDLERLEDAGQLIRSHGGVHHPSAMGGEPSLALKRRSFMDRKRSIARAVADEIPRGAVVFLDSGSTCLEVARLLRARRDLTVVTNSIPVLASHHLSKCRIICLGGEVREVSGALVGDTTVSGIGGLRADVAILGASGISLSDGASTTEPGERSVKKAMMQRSSKRWLAVDSSKAGKEAGFPFAQWEEFELVFSDALFPAETTPLPDRIRFSSTQTKQ